MGMANRDNKSTAGLELLYESLGDMVDGSRDDNSVKRGVFPPSQGSISLAYSTLS